MDIRLFDFILPPELIAQEPSAQRDQSRLLVLQRERDTPPLHTQFSKLGSFLQAGDLLVLNNTRVFSARLPAQKTTGGKVELLLVEPISDGVSVLHPHNLLKAQDKNVANLPVSTDKKTKTACENRGYGEIWRVLAKASRPLSEGSVLILPDHKQAQVLSRVEGGEYLLALDSSLHRPYLFSYLEQFGEIPLPPYIDPDHATIDHKQRYQTIFARHMGAVAAPTAGLHFTPLLLEQLQDQGIRVAELTLHVGLGTFLPVRVDNILEHAMHSEHYEIPEATVKLWEKTKAMNRRVIAVGTTALRALESATQGAQAPIPGANATSIFIYPGYKFRAVDGLITNFHLPRSTLLMLVSALHGRERLLRVYEEAIVSRYRFYSYGDAMLILPTILPDA